MSSELNMIVEQVEEEVTHADLYLYYHMSESDER